MIHKNLNNHKGYQRRFLIIQLEKKLEKTKSYKQHDLHGLQVLVFELYFFFYNRFRLKLLRATGETAVKKHVEHIESSKTSERIKMLTFCKKR